jgi:uncharacterized membrane protein YqjE
MREVLAFACAAAIVFFILAALVRIAIIVCIIIDETVRWTVGQIRSDRPKPRRNRPRG